MDTIITNMFISAWNELMRVVATMVMIAGGGYILVAMLKRKIPEWMKLWRDAEEKRHKNALVELRLKTIISERNPVFKEKEE